MNKTAEEEIKIVFFLIQIKVYLYFKSKKKVNTTMLIKRAFKYLVVLFYLK